MPIYLKLNNSTKTQRPPIIANKSVLFLHTPFSLIDLHRKLNLQGNYFSSNISWKIPFDHNGT